MRTSRTVFLSRAVAALVPLFWAGALPIHSQSDEAKGDGDPGPFVEVAEWWATARDLNLDYAFLDSGGLSGGGDVRTLGSERNGVLRMTGGWRFNAPGDPRLSLSVWESDTQSADATGVVPGEVGALLTSPDFNGSPAFFPSIVDFASATTRVRGTSADVDFSWDAVAGERGRLSVALGVRLFRFEETRLVTYRVTSSTSLEELIIANVDTSGLGPRAAFFFAYPIGQRVTIGAGLGLAVPIGETKGDTSDAVFSDGSFVIATIVNRLGTRRTYFQLDGGMRVDVRLGKGLSVMAGYEFQRWEGVALRHRFVDVVGQSATVPVEEDVVFEGLLAGFRFEF